jgi:hypothetical protein
MKIKNYRILLTIWIALILYFLGQFLYTSLFQTIYPSLLDKLYAITSFMWKYFLSILVMSLFTLIPPFDSIIPSRDEKKEETEEIDDLVDASPEKIENKLISGRVKAIIVGIMLILAFFFVRHIVFVNVYSNFYLIVWNFIYGHIFVSVISVLLLILVLYFSFKNAGIREETDEI